MPLGGNRQGPLMCWGCGRNDMIRDYPHNQDNQRNLHYVKEATTMEDVARETPRIFVALED